MLSVRMDPPELLIALVFAGIVAAIAASRGRNAFAWFFIGLFLNCIGLVLLLVLPDLKAQNAERDHLERVNRRLQEKLAMDRQLADQRHQHVERRLGSHDEALGIDTTNPPPLTADGGTAALSDGTLWFYARERERLGPVTGDTIRHLLLAAAIGPDTLVWCQGMPDWAPLRTVPAFQREPS